MGGSEDLTGFEHSKGRLLLQQVTLWKRNAWKEFLEGVSGLAGLWIQQSRFWSCIKSLYETMSQIQDSDNILYPKSQRSTVFIQICQ